MFLELTRTHILCFMAIKNPKLRKMYQYFSSENFQFLQQCLCFRRCKLQVFSVATVKFLNFWMPENFAEIYLKFKKTGQTFGYFGKKDGNGIANSEDPDQTAPLGAAWSGSALFAQTCLSENLGSLRYSIIFQAAPMAEWVKSLNFSALYHLIISPLCLV